MTTYPVNIFNIGILALGYIYLDLTLAFAHRIKHLRRFTGKRGILIQYYPVLNDSATGLFIERSTYRSITVIANVGQFNIA